MKHGSRTYSHIYIVNEIMIHINIFNNYLYIHIYIYIIWPDMKILKKNISEPIGPKRKFTDCVLARKYIRHNTLEA